VIVADDMATKFKIAKDADAMAYWHMNNVTARDVVKLDVVGKISDVLALLNKVDGISMNIVITIKNNSK
jgi:hypothetical protein